MKVSSGSAIKVAVRALLAGRGEASTPHEKKSAVRYEDLFRELRHAQMPGPQPSTIPINIPTARLPSNANISRLRSRTMSAASSRSDESVSLQTPAPEAPQPTALRMLLGEDAESDGEGRENDTTRLLAKELPLKSRHEREGSNKSQDKKRISLISLRKDMPATGTVVPLDSVGAIRKSIDFPWTDDPMMKTQGKKNKKRYS